MSSPPYPTLLGPEADLLDELLHALGQPLTVLGTCRLLARTPGAPEAGLLDELADQVDRARELYDALRLLLTHPGERVSVHVFLREYDRGFGAQRLQATMDEDAGSSDQRVLAGTLRTALASSEPGQAISVRVREGWLEVEGGQQLNSARTPWLLRVAKAVAEGAEVAMVYKLQPFHARVRLHRV